MVFKRLSTTGAQVLPAERGASAGGALRLRSVSKTFLGVRALVDVDLDVRPGTIHALLGHNGSGKSTLIKCLAGVHSPDPGAEAAIFGTDLALGDGHDAHRKGLRFVHQDLGIIPELGAADNVGFATGYQRSALGGISWRRQARSARELLERFGFDLDPDTPMAAATPPQRAAVAIVRAVADWHDSRGVLVLDEPTAALPAHEVDRLFALLREIKAMGAAVIFVSHRLDEVVAVADHATVLRDGSKVWDGAIEDVTLQGLVDLVVGAETARPVESAEPVTARPTTTGPPALEIRNLHGRYLRGVSLTVKPGEIVGIAGLLGSGREELPYVVAGSHTEGVAGDIAVRGTPMAQPSVRRARQLGVVLVPADRGAEGVFDGFSTIENVSLGALGQIRRAGALTPRAERQLAERWLTSVHANVAYGPRPMSTLSGGNQQKAILARSLSVLPGVLVLSEPTAGIDIGARQVIYDELRRRADDGLAILVASSDVEDLLACCDRLIALRNGRIAAELPKERMSKSAIAYAIEGAHDEQG